MNCVSCRLVAAVAIVAGSCLAEETISFHDGQNGYRTTDMSNVLIRAGSALDLPARDWELYLLGYSGERLERLPVQIEDGQLVLKLDTAKFRHGPTPFFELVKANCP